MSISYKPIPVHLGDTYGSTLAVMLFPDNLKKAKAWHSKRLAKGALQTYLSEGHCFEDRFIAFSDAVGAAETTDREAARRFAGGRIAGDVFKVLWAFICDARDTASWSRAVSYVCDQIPAKEAGSPSHIRGQLKLFAPVMHLWLGWQLSESARPTERELFDIGYPILFAAREWAASRPSAFRPGESYLSAKEYGPWPDLAKEMQLKPYVLRAISLGQPMQTSLQS